VVVDDVIEIQQLVDHWLRHEGHDVTCASSGRQALKVIQEQPVDLVITDIIMPDGDGLEVIGQVRRKLPTARVLAISGGGMHLHAGECLKFAQSLGAHAVLMKPFKREQLLEAVNRITRGQHVSAVAAG
jgi:CheY-like chemotaxis protein